MKVEPFLRKRCLLFAQPLTVPPPYFYRFSTVLPVSVYSIFFNLPVGDGASRTCALFQFFFLLGFSLVVVVVGPSITHRIHVVGR